MTSNGIDVSIVIGEAEKKMSGTYKKLFDQEWLQGFVTEAQMHLEANGLVVVQFVPSDVLKGEMVPRVLSPHHFILYKTDVPGEPIKFEVYRREVGGINGSSFNGNFEMEPMNDVLVWQRNDILWNGELSSPIAVCSERLAQLEDLYSNQNYADYFRVHRIWAYQRMPGAIQPNPMAEDHYGEADTTGAEQDYRRMVQQDQVDQLQNSIATSLERNVKHARPIEDSLSRYGPNRNAKSPPYQNYFTVPDGLQVANPPLPEVLPNAIDTIEQLISDVCNAFLVPPSMVVQTRASYQSHVQNEQRRLNQTIQSRQLFMENILERLYMIIYKNSHQSEAAKKTNQLLDNEEAEQQQQKNLPSDEITPGEKRTSIKPSLLKAQDIYEELLSKISVQIRFRRYPFASLADIDFLTQRGYIAEQTAAEVSVGQVGLDASAVTDEETRQRELQTKRKREEEATKKNPQASSDKS